MPGRIPAILIVLLVAIGAACAHAPERAGVESPAGPERSWVVVKPAPAVTGETSAVEAPAPERDQTGSALVRAVRRCGGGGSAADEIARLAAGTVDAVELAEAVDACSDCGPVCRDLLVRAVLLLRHLGEYDLIRERFGDRLAGIPGLESVAGEVAASARSVPGRIGVVLPLSGEYRVYGERLLQAVLLAADLLSADPSSRRLPAGGGLELVIRDDGGTESGAARALSELALDEGVVAVLGPLMSRTGDAAVWASRRLRLPVVTFSRADGLTGRSRWLFRNGVTNAMQARAVARHAVDLLGIRSFGIMYPRHPYGIELAMSFWDEVEARGGEVTGVEWYDPEATSFIEPARSLVGNRWPEYRADYHRFMQENRSKYASEFKWNRAREGFLRNLQPLVDFDALFIPDFHRQVSLVAPALAFENIEVRTGRLEEERRIRMREERERVRIRQVQLLGANGWNHPDLIPRGGRYVEGAVFCDSFHAGSEEPRVQAFVQAFSAAFDREPNQMDALAYETVMMIRELHAEGRTADRESIRAALASGREFAGLFGSFGFDPAGESVRRLLMLTVREGRIVPVEPREAGDAGTPGAPAPAAP